MSEDVILSVESVSKQYRLGQIGTGTLSHDLKRWWYRVRGLEDPFLKVGEANDRSRKGSSDYVWALRDVSFDVRQGEVLGIIGKNGAGKSTLLKILSKVTAPTTGRIRSKGRIASLLEVGTGFHPELTGRENIFLNGAILGMSKKEIASKLEDIIAFSGCERYIDTPVKRYSSGMTVRLAFAVAAFLEPEILIVDEVLAVGDAEFQKKALGKMQDISKGQGRTVLFVSHDMNAIESLCHSVVVLEHGAVIKKASPQEAIAHYLSSSKNTDLSKARRTTEGDLWLDAIQLNGSDALYQTVRSGDALEMVFTLNRRLSLDEVKAVGFYVVFRNERNVILFTISNRYDDMQIVSAEKYTSFRCLLPDLNLTGGVYKGTTWMSLRNGFCDEVEEAFHIEVLATNYFGTGQMPVARKHGALLMKQNWTAE